MFKEIQLLAFAKFAARISPLVVPFLFGPAMAEAKQCSAERPSDTKAHWSYRLIDGRKCWYEGENGLSKSLLEWRATTSATQAKLSISILPKRPAHIDEVSSGRNGSVSSSAPAQGVSDKPPVRILTVKSDNAPRPSDGFEERWRALDELGKY